MKQPLKREARACFAVILSFLLAASPLEPRGTEQFGSAVGRTNNVYRPADHPTGLARARMTNFGRRDLSRDTAPIGPRSNSRVTTNGSGRLKSFRQSAAQATTVQTKFPGQTATLMPDGRYLLVGGENSGRALDAISLLDPATGTVSTVSGLLARPRAWHTATLLPDGTVFIFGGTGVDGTFVDTPEIYDPATQKSHSVSVPQLLVRAHHTATLLTDGRVLFAGGAEPERPVSGSLQLWEVRAGTVQNASVLMLVARKDHSASLGADGFALFWRGQTGNNVAINDGEIFDPVSQSQQIVANATQLQTTSGPAFVVASLPVNHATEVPVDTQIALRFSQLLDVRTVNSSSVTLSSADGAVDVKVIPAEAGRLAFVTPLVPLNPGTEYTISVNGAKDVSGNELEPSQIVFTTAGTGAAGVLGTGINDETGPLDDNYHRLPPLQAPKGVTALAGQVLKLNAKPLKHVLLQIDTQQTFTDGTGRFLLENITPGHHAMVIDGSSANHHGIEYGIYEDGVDIKAGETNVLNYTVWMTALDVQNEVTIPSPTTSELVITTPKLPGLELHIPPNTVIKDRNENVVTRISITPIPVSQPPFPLPEGVDVPIYFTIQPGGAYLEAADGSWGPGARLFYPNLRKAPPGTAFDFWNYDPLQKGWYIYGEGRVDKSAETIVPDPGVEIYQFTGAMVGGPANAKIVFPNDPSDPRRGEPVNLSTGLFVYNKTDLVVQDVIPLVFTRTYTTEDSIVRSLGIGTMSNYDIIMVGDTNPYTYQELVLPDGSRIHFYRTSTGTSYTNAVYVHTGSNTRWYGATLRFGSTNLFPQVSWILTSKDGTSYYFPDGSGQSNPLKMALLGISDRFGNTVTIARDGNGNATKITSTNGRFITLQHDANNRITQIEDNIGRTVQYQYDAVGRINQVTDAAGGLWKYTYDSNNNMLTIQDARGITYLTNQYDSNGHVIKQTQADNSTYQFAWTFTSNTSEAPYAVIGGVPEGGGSAGAGQAMIFRNCAICSAGFSPLVSQVNVTDPNGYVEQVKFGPTGYITTDTFALGKAEQQTYTYNYYADNLLQSIADPLGRTITYSYDANANVTSITALSGTSNAVTTTLAYEPNFNQILNVTDPLQHTTSFGYDGSGNFATVTDPLNHSTNFAHDSEGRLIGLVDALGHGTKFEFSSSGDLVSASDPLGRNISRAYDAAGRLTSVIDPTGNETKLAYNALNQVTSITDPLGNTTSFGYDPNGNLLSVTDANNHTTQYTYNNMDRVATRKDALQNVDSYQWDGNGNLIQFTDRRSKVTSYTYDGLNRRTFTGFGTVSGPPVTYESTVSYTYGNVSCGALQCYTMTATDSISGAVTRTDDALDRLASETTPQGTVSYAYDAAGRRSSLTVPGQSVANYTFDNANRLTQIAQGSTTVSFSYDNANRRVTLTLPDGIIVNYSYDNASQLTALSYVKGSTTLGNLTYGYDLNGRRTSIGGSLAATNLPNAVSTTAYNANNQLTTWGTANLYYDVNGNMTSDGTHSYTWDARNHLSSIDSGTTASFVYDPLGRRASKTILGSQTGFLYDRANPIQELSGATVTANSLMGVTDEVFQRADSNGARSFLSDALGSSIALTDSNGTLQTQYTFDPFGNTTASGSTSTNSFAYTSRELDATGLYFNRARYYNPLLQRFISEDPLKFRGGDTNLYAYAFDSPTNLSDPFGLTPLGGDPGGDPGMAGRGCDCASPPPWVGSIPPVPPGVSIDDNIDQAADLSDFTGAPPDVWMYDQFQTGGPQDYKQLPDGQQYVDFGNYNFGAVCAAVGHSLVFCQSAAGAAHLGRIVKLDLLYLLGKTPYLPTDFAPGLPFLYPPYGDQPDDSNQIGLGYGYGIWKKRCRSRKAG